MDVAGIRGDSNLRPTGPGQGVPKIVTLGSLGKGRFNPNAPSLCQELGKRISIPNKLPSKGSVTRKSSKRNTKGAKDVEGHAEEEDTDHKVKEKDKKKGVKRVLEIREARGKNRRGQQEGFFARLERLAQQKRIESIQDIINEAWAQNGSGHFEDITEGYEGIREAQFYFSQKKDDALKNLSVTCLAAADELYRNEKTGPDIRAGFIFGLEDRDHLTLYREKVLRFESVPEAFKSIMEHSNEEPKAFKTDVERLIQDIQVDLKAQESTLDPIHLNTILRGFYKLQICLQLEEECHQVLVDLNELHQLGPYASEKETVNSVTLAYRALELTESTWLEPESFTTFTDLLELPPGPGKVDFYQRFIALFKRMPEKLIPAETQNKLQEAGSEFLDQIIEEEENYLEEEGEN